MTSFDATAFDTNAFDAPVEEEHARYSQAAIALLDHVQTHDLRGLKGLNVEELQVQRAARKALFDYITWLAETHRSHDVRDHEALTALRDLAGGLLGNTAEIR